MLQIRFPYITLSIVFIFSLFFYSTVSASTIARPMSNSGLVGYWNFEEGTGNSRTFDRTGRGNTGILTAMDPLTDWVNGATSTGQALDFDGTDDFVSGTSIDLANSPLTISAWIKPRSYSSNRVYFSIGSVAASDKAIHLRETSNTSLLFGMYSDDLNVTVSNMANVWSHVVVTLDSSKDQTVYFNSVSVGSRTATGMFTGNSDWNIGKFIALGSEQWDGLIDEVRVYNRILSADEIVRLYNLKKPKEASGINNTGLVGFWAFEEGTGIRAEDNSINNNHGSLTLGPPWVQGKVGGALSFDGSNDSVSIGTNANLNITSSVTLTAWIRASALPVGSAYKPIISATDSSYYLAIHATNEVYIGINDGVTPYECRSNGANLATSTNYFLAVVFDDNANDLNIYVNGVQQAETVMTTSCSPAITLDSNTNGIDLGGNGEEYLNGIIDEVRIYNRALSATEVLNLYKGSKATVVNKTNKTKITNGLVGYWTFDGKDIYTTTAIDRSGSGNNGTLTNGPVPTIGKIGQALKFDGVDDYVDVPHNSTLEITGSVTISAWINYLTNTVDSNETFVSKGECYNTICPYELDVQRSSRFIRFTHNDGSAGQDALATPNDVVSPGVWQHIVAVRDSGAVTRSIYVNGLLQVGPTAYTKAPTASGDAFRIGDMDPAAQPFSGQIDDVRIYNRALTADEVYQLYNSGR